MTTSLREKKKRLQTCNRGERGREAWERVRIMPRWREEQKKEGLRCARVRNGETLWQREKKKRKGEVTDYCLVISLLETPPIAAPNITTWYLNPMRESRRELGLKLFTISSAGPIQCLRSIWLEMTLTTALWCIWSSARPTFVYCSSELHSCSCSAA